MSLSTIPSFLAAVTLSACLFLSCQSDSGSIREVADKFLHARMAGDFGQAALFVALNSQEQLEELEILSLEYLEEGFSNFSYRIKQVNQDGNDAEVLYDLEGYGNASLLLTQENGAWKIHLTAFDVPDAGLLLQDLLALEREDTSDLDQEALDAILMAEEPIDDWLDSLPID